MRSRSKWAWPTPRHLGAQAQSLVRRHGGECVRSLLTAVLVQTPSMRLTLTNFSKTDLSYRQKRVLINFSTDWTAPSWVGLVCSLELLQGILDSSATSLLEADQARFSITRWDVLGSTLSRFSASPTLRRTHLIILVASARSAQNQKAKISTLASPIPQSILK